MNALQTRPPRHVRASTGSNLQKVKAQNLFVVLDTLRRHQPISRKDLALATGLTAATITNLVAELMALDLLQEARSGTRGVGRRPTFLTLRADRASIIGVEISRVHVCVCLTNLAGKVLRRSAQIYNPPSTPGAVLEIVHALIGAVWDEDAPPVGIGVGVPGPVDTRAGVVLEPPNFPGWQHLPLASLLQEHWGCPVYLDDDAKTAVLGEYWFGAARFTPNLIYVSLGSGVGAGVVIEDHLHRGTHELAGQFGHMTLDLAGPPCGCGNRGCLEALISVPALEARYAEAAGPSSSKSFAALPGAALSGDLVAQRILNETSQYLGAGLVNVINLFDPDRIVLGGLLVRAWSELIPQVTAQVQGRLYRFAAQSVSITASELGADSSMLGAASLIIEHIHQHPHLLGSVER